MEMTIFDDCAVDAKSVSDFLDKYYKRERYRGRGTEYAKTLLTSYELEFDKRGLCFISQHDSNTGELVAFFGNN